jgi:hypothetical protein
VICWRNGSDDPTPGSGARWCSPYCREPCSMSGRNPSWPPRGYLVTTAMLALLGFCTVVVATLMTRLIVLGNAWSPQTGRYQALQLYFTVPAFAGAILMGRAIGRLHHNHRVICVLGCSITATIASCLNLYLFVPNVLRQPLVPHAATQIAVGVVFIAGLFVGIGSGSLCEPQSSS